MFRYGRTNGYLTIALIVLAIVPLVEAFFMIPEMPDSVAMAFGTGGEPTRYGSRYELLLVPGICLLLGLGTVLAARQQAKTAVKSSHAATEFTYRRSIRNGLVMVVILNLGNIYLFVTAFMGRGFSLAL